MRTLNKLPVLLLTVITLFAAGCKKDKTSPVVSPEITKFQLEATNHVGITANVEGVIVDKQIAIRVPNSLDVNAVKPSFVTNPENAIVYIGSTVQQSGVTVANLSEPAKYRLVSEGGTAEYTVTALRNAAILSYGFYAEDNPGVLFRDYQGEVKGLEINVALPVDAEVDNLVARFTTSANATVRVGSTAQVSESTANNFTTAVTYAVSDAESTAPDNFVVSVTRLTAPAWTLIPNTGLSSRVSSLRLAIHPVSNEPYVIYALPNGAVNNEAARRKVVVARYSSNNWVFLGSSEGFSANRSELTSIAIDNNGVVYAAYKDFADGDKVQNASVQKFESGSWTYMGTQQFTAHRVNNVSIAVGSNNNPVLGYNLARAEGGLANRAPYAYEWNNNAWQGRPITSVSAVFFARTFTGNDGNVYYTGMDMTVSTTERNPTLLRLNNGNWEVVGTPLVSAVPGTFGATLIDGAVAEDRTAYLAFQSQANTEKKSFVVRYDGSRWEQIGDEINHTAGSNAERDNIALAVHPNGTLYFAYGDANGLWVTQFNEDTGNWDNTKQLRTTKVDKIDLKISKDGVPYLLASDMDTDTDVILYKYDIPTN